MKLAKCSRKNASHSPTMLVPMIITFISRPECEPVW